MTLAERSRHEKRSAQTAETLLGQNGKAYGGSDTACCKHHESLLTTEADEISQGCINRLFLLSKILSGSKKEP